MKLILPIIFSNFSFRRLSNVRTRCVCTSGPKWYCPVVNLFNFSCFLCSTALILTMTFDRFYSIIAPHKAASFNTVKRSKITVACITIVSFLFNIPHFYLSSNTNWECTPYGNAKGYSLSEFYYWLSFLVQFALPFVLLLALNSVIIHKIRTRFKNPSHGTSIGDSSQGENSSKGFGATGVCNFTFGNIYLPDFNYSWSLVVSICNGHRFLTVSKSFATYYLFYHVSHKIYITNYGINFYLYVISGRKFRTDVKNLFPFIKNRSNKTHKESVVSTIEHSGLRQETK